jgi:cytochrome c peroxidase
MARRARTPAAWRLSSEMSSRTAFAGLGLCATAIVVLLVLRPDPTAGQRLGERQTKEALVLAMSPLPQLAPDPTNRFADDPAAAAFGKQLFFDKGLSGNGQVACATCHQPERYFSDGLRVARGVGETERNAPSVLGAAFNTWQFWDGRADSQWAQAASPIEAEHEHGFDRSRLVQRLRSHYTAPFEDLFGPLPKAGDTVAETRAFAHAMKAIAAYERKLLPRRAPIDGYVAALRSGDRTGGNYLSAAQRRGLDLFVGVAQCHLCHSGPLFTDDSFHNLGLPAQLGIQACKGEACGAEGGRTFGALQVLQGEFNCRSAFSDTSDCPELRHLNPGFDDFIGAFKTPSLRNVERTAPYMHDGQFADLDQVLKFYNTVPGEPVLGHRELFLKPLRLKPNHLADLRAFLSALTGPLPDPRWSSPPKVVP